MKSCLLYLLISALVILIACSEERIPYEYQVPEKTGDGGEVASMNASGMDPEPLEVMTNIL